MALPLIYDPRFHTWDSWASLMVEAYASQQLAIPAGEEHWKEWAAGLRGIDIFINDAAPTPYEFDNWRDWAEALVNAVNPRIE